MEIKNTTQYVDSYNTVRQQKVAESKGDESKGASVAGHKDKDTVTLSSAAKLYNSALSVAANTDEIRQDKVAGLKAQIDSGTYKPSAQSIARGLLMQDAELASTFKE